MARTNECFAMQKCLGYEYCLFGHEMSRQLEIVCKVTCLGILGNKRSIYNLSRSKIYNRKKPRDVNVGDFQFLMFV